MNRGTYFKCVLGTPLFFVLMLLPKPLAKAGAKESAHALETNRRHLIASYGKLPLSFEANTGQTNKEVEFLSRGQGYMLFLTKHAEAVVRLDAASTPHIQGRKADASLAAGQRQSDSSAASVFRLKLLNAQANPRSEGLEQLSGKANYFIGNDPTKWRTNVPIYSKVSFHGVYPGVNLAYYGNQRRLEYDFIVAPNANPGSIAMATEGANASLNAEGDLILAVKGEEVRLQKPLAYQNVNGRRQEIASSYLLKSAHELGFQLGAYDHSQPLIIDPVLSYSTYLGGSTGAGGDAIAVDSAGNAYVTGGTSASDFPTTSGAFQTTGPPACQPQPLSGAQCANDAFVTKLNADGSALVYSTFLGGSGINNAYAIAVDSAGNAYVTGATNTMDFPTFAAFQPVNRAFLNGGFNAFVTKLNADGTGLVYSTYLGGSGGFRGNLGESEGGDGAHGIAVDSGGNAYVTGSTTSPDFPTTLGAFQTRTHATNPISGTNAFITKLHFTGALLLYSTYLGGSSNTDYASAIAVDNLGHAYVAGSTASTDFPTTLTAFQPVAPPKMNSFYTSVFVTEMGSGGSALVYSTYLGGASQDGAAGIAIDSGGNAYVTGGTDSSNFPTTPGAFQFIAPTKTGFSVESMFVTKLNSGLPGRLGLVYSTYVGGSGNDGAASIAVDSSGDAFVTGVTASTDFPTTANAIQPAFAAGGVGNAFVLALNPQGAALLYSSYLGGTGGYSLGAGIALDSSFNAYVVGGTISTSFPTTPGAFQSTAPQSQGNGAAFVTKISGIISTPVFPSGGPVAPCCPRTVIFR